MGLRPGSALVGPVRVAWAAARRSTPAIPPAALGREDLQRLEELAPRLRSRFVVGRLLIHNLVAGLLPLAAGWTVVPRTCQRCGGAHAGVDVVGVPACASVSYAPGVVVVAVASTTRVSRMGVDIEPCAADPGRLEGFRRMLGASTEPTLRRWTRLQAVLKADGRGLLLDPGSVYLRRGGAWIAGQSASYAVAEVVGPAGFHVSLAWSSAAPAGASPVQAGHRMNGAAGIRWDPGPC